MRTKIRESLELYAKKRIPTGSFLRSVLENNLMESFGRADEQNIEDMHEIVTYVYNVLPAECHGSPEKVMAWLNTQNAKQQNGGHNEHTNT